MFEQEDVQKSPPMLDRLGSETQTADDASLPQSHSPIDPLGIVSPPGSSNLSSAPEEKDRTRQEASDQLTVERDQLRQQIQHLLSDKDSLITRLDRLSVENHNLQATVSKLELSRKEEVEKHGEAKAGFERQFYELSISIQHERNVMIQNFSLELEKERGKILGE